MIGPLPLASVATSPIALIPAPYAPIAPPSTLTATLPVDPSLLLPPRGLAGGLGSTATGARVNVVRDEAKAITQNNVEALFSLPGGTKLNVTADAPVSGYGVTHLLDQNEALAHLTHDGARPGSVVTYYVSETTSNAVTFVNPPQDARVTLDGTGEDFLIDYNASGAAGGLRIDTSAAGPNVVLNADGGLPSALSGLVSRGPTGDCSGAERPVGAKFSTLGKGLVGGLEAKVWDTAAPNLSAESGAVFACPGGAAPAFAARLVQLDELTLMGNGCAWTIAAPVSSLNESNFTLDTEWFEANLKLRLKDAPLALLAAGIGNGGFYAYANGTLGPETFSKANATYLRKDASTLIGTSLANTCLSFGEASVKTLWFEAADLGGELDGTIGQDRRSRPLIQVNGTGAEWLDAGIEIETSGSQDDDLNATLSFPVENNVTVRYYASGLNPPSSGDALGNYAVVGSGPGIDGGSIRLFEFQNASIILDRSDTGAANLTHLELDYHASALGKPLYVSILNNDTTRIDVKAGALPAFLSGALDLEWTGAMDFEGSLDYTLGRATPLSVRFIDATLATKIYAMTSSFPPEARLELSAGPNSVGDVQFDFDYASGNVMPLVVLYNGENASSTLVEIDSLPPQLAGSVRITTCGVVANAELREAGLDLLRITQNPGTTSTPATPQTPNTNAPDPTAVTPRRSPGCPAPQIGQDDGQAPVTTDEPPDKSKTTFIAELHRVPAGTLDVNLTLGTAGSLRFESSGGAIGNLHADVTTVSDDGTSRFLVDAQDVILKAANWDIDGDTRYEDNPHYLYLSTGGATTGRITIDAQIPDKGRISLDTNGRVILGAREHDGFQVKWYTRVYEVLPPPFDVAPLASTEDEKMAIAGCAILFDGKFDAEIEDHPVASWVLRRKTELGSGTWGKCT